MHEHPPAVRSDQPLDRHAPAMRPQLVPALAVAHPIDGALAVELRAAFAEAEQRSFAEEKRQARLVSAECQALDGLSLDGVDVNRRRVGGVTHREIARAHGSERIGRPSPRQRLPFSRRDERAVVRHASCADDGGNGDAHGDRADRGDGDLDRHPGDANRRRLAADHDRAESRGRPGGGEMFQRAAAGEAFGHRDILVQAELLRLTSGSVTGQSRVRPVSDPRLLIIG